MPTSSLRLPFPALARSLAPWRDRNGRFSPLRAVVLAALLTPALWLAYRAGSGDLGPRPITEALRFAGDRAIETLIVTIAITPLRKLSGWSKLIGVRRMIGLAAFFWTATHFGLYALDNGFDPAKIATEIVLRPYLLLGFFALCGLAALAATSTDGMIRRLGGPAWGRLHGLVHPIVIMGLVHLFLQVRLDPATGAWLAGAAVGGLAIRVLLARAGGVGWGGVAFASGVATFAGAAAELAWFAAKTKRPLAPIAWANFDTAFRVAPSWWAGATVALLAGGALLFQAWKRREARKARPAAR